MTNYVILPVYDRRVLAFDKQYYGLDAASHVLVSLQDGVVTAVLGHDDTDDPSLRSGFNWVLEAVVDAYLQGITDQRNSVGN